MTSLIYWQKIIQIRPRGGATERFLRFFSIGSLAPPCDESLNFVPKGASLECKLLNDI